jgi:hypothetical protein
MKGRVNFEPHLCVWVVGSHHVLHIKICLDWMDEPSAFTCVFQNHGFHTKETYASVLDMWPENEDMCAGGFFFFF